MLEVVKRVCVLGHFSWLQFIPGVGHHYLHVASALLTSVVMIIVGVIVRRQLRAHQKKNENNSPCKRFSPLGFCEVMLEFICSQSDAIIGKSGRHFVPFFTFLFLFIFLNNFLGLLPGFTPATDNLNTTFAIGIISFVLYNVLGIKEQGVINYIKHFMGPIWWIAPLLFAIEVISHLFRPFTLGLRLMGNMTGDHTVLGAFLELVPIGVPVIFYCLGLFVCFVQALVFTLLSMVYVSMAVAHNH